MRNYDIIKLMHYKILKEYIVHFRFYFEGYNLYCRKNKFLKNFLIELLIDAA